MYVLLVMTNMCWKSQDVKIRGVDVYFLLLHCFTSVILDDFVISDFLDYFTEQDATHLKELLTQEVQGLIIARNK